MESLEVQKYWTEDCGLHPQLLVDSAIGVIPPDIDVTQFYLAKLEEAEAERARVLAAPRKVGRPTKKEQQAIDAALSAVERLKKERDDFANFLDGRGDWLLFVYTDGTHRRVRLRAWSPKTDESAEMSFGLVGGVFNNGLFAPGHRAKSLEQIQNRSIVVASEFDVLQLQSLGARLAESEGLKPQAGYLKAAAVGAGSVDAATVRALGQLPLVIRNGGNLAAAARVVDAIRQELNLYAITVPKRQTLVRISPAQSETHLQPNRGQASTPLCCQRPVRLGRTGLFVFEAAFSGCGSGRNEGGRGTVNSPDKSALHSCAAQS